MGGIKVKSVLDLVSYSENPKLGGYVRSSLDLLESLMGIAICNIYSKKSNLAPFDK